MSFVFGKSSYNLCLDWFVIDIFIWTWIINNFYHLNWFSLGFFYSPSIYFAFRQIMISIWTWSLTWFLWSIILSWFCWLDSHFFDWLLLWSNIIKSSRWISTNPLSISFPNTIMCNCCKINRRVFIWAWNFGLIAIGWRPRRFCEIILCPIEMLMWWNINLLL